MNPPVRNESTKISADIFQPEKCGHSFERNQHPELTKSIPPKSGPRVFNGHLAAPNRFDDGGKRMSIENIRMEKLKLVSFFVIHS